MAAVSTAFFALLSAGDHVVCSASVYGPSRVVLERDFSRFGVTATMVDTSDADELRAAITDRTRVVFIETPANPTLAITDIAAGRAIAHEAGAVLVVDNTFMSPILQKPFRFGADVVLHSVTKFLNGHSDVVGGILLFRDDALMRGCAGAALPGRHHGPAPGVARAAGREDAGHARAHGAGERAGRGALLARTPRWRRCATPGCRATRRPELIARQMAGPGSLISFELKGGIEAGRQLLKAVRLPALAVSLGGVESLIQHPASMTHAGMWGREDRLARPASRTGSVRLSVGCEDATTWSPTSAHAGLPPGDRDRTPLRRRAGSGRDDEHFTALAARGPVPAHGRGPGGGEGGHGGRGDVATAQPSSTPAAP
jgi:methionine-gamma-lyase